jgi:hypothetical protein
MLLALDTGPCRMAMETPPTIANSAMDKFWQFYIPSNMMRKDINSGG